MVKNALDESGIPYTKGAGGVTFSNLNEPEERIKFVLNGCDILFIAEAPADITLRQLLKQCDRIKPWWCACGICSLERAGYSSNQKVEVSIDYNDVKIVDEYASCTILEDEA